MPAISLLIKPSSGNCNMRCKYCFYADEMQNREVSSYGFMTLDTLDKVMSTTLDYATNQCTIAFQGGEPTLIGLDFYKEFIKIVDKYNKNNCQISYAIQTNGYVLNEDWAKFFKKHNFLVGISLDGLKEIHDEYRPDAKGEGTFKRVITSIGILKAHKVDFNILTVINNKTGLNAKKIYEFYKKKGYQYQQYIECLDPLEQVAGWEDYSLKPEVYTKFLKELFDVWYEDMMKGHYTYIRYFENVMMLIAGVRPESCTMESQCGKQWVVEADGSVYPCDFYVLDKWKLGNLRENTIEEIEKKRNELNFVGMSIENPDDCRKCEWFGLCKNGCRRHCEPFVNGHRQKNYFCESYKEFLPYSVPRFKEIMKLWLKK